MNESFSPKNGWGPQAKRAALCVTFDNFGEASDIEAGFWGDQPVGHHYTVDFIPELIKVLGETRATYFVEAINVGIYPEALRSWNAAGHEIGIHGWRHEMWAGCDAGRRRKLLRDSVTAMRSIGVQPRGFRPPGGETPAEAWDEFEQVGMLYCSDLSSQGIRRVGNMMSMPFQWHGVDAYMLEDMLGFLRVRCGDPEPPYSLAQWVQELTNTVDTILHTGGQATLIFHPHFLATDPNKLNVLRELLKRVRRNPDLWVTTTDEVARFAANEIGLAAAAA